MIVDIKKHMLSRDDVNGRGRLCQPDDDAMQYVHGILQLF